MNQPYGSRPAFPIAFFLFALAMSSAAAGAAGGEAQATAPTVSNLATPAPAASAPAAPMAATEVPTRPLSIPPRALRLKNPPPAPLRHLTYSAREGFALRMVSNQEVTAEIRNGAGRTLAYTERNLEAGDWTLRPRNLAPGLYTVLLRTGPNLRALRLKIEDVERGQGRPEWVVEKAPDSTRAPVPASPG
jgi:hypothetical protein